MAAGTLVDEDPEAAYRHAKTARRLASRVGVVREACGLAAYHAGEWSEALSELRAARRLPGREDLYLPVLADCERGLGRPEKALEIARSKEASSLPREERIELHIVESGARRDLGDVDAAVIALQIPELKDRRLRPWSARLFYAYADALVAADRADDAKDWFLRAAAADRDEETDAAERYAELDGLHIIDTGDNDEPSDTTESSPFIPSFQAAPSAPLAEDEEDEDDEEDYDDEDEDLDAEDDLEEDDEDLEEDEDDEFDEDEDEDEDDDLEDEDDEDEDELPDEEEDEAAEAPAPPASDGAATPPRDSE
ncbi:hypothetical protein EDD29_1610 [Actinocorallia herbida]|uniref:Tetratricopeptide repeat protein n=1 Tax=Actinocorallia herbida TaxID=58109 RepID=A0A3N1CS06_9ACTN|nr:hypothetical protein EDD29_1610 [Actinocorallia herbida]